MKNQDTRSLLIFGALFVVLVSILTIIDFRALDRQRQLADTGPMNYERTGTTLSVAEMACTPGMQIDCACGGGVRGLQVCGTDGMSFGACQCPDAPVKIGLKLGDTCDCALDGQKIRTDDGPGYCLDGVAFTEEAYKSIKANPNYKYTVCKTRGSVSK
ncbi:MAG: hypothetical protein WC750_00850 [Patescibacteria group bacterium]|jgi:hypothetical protein